MFQDLWVAVGLMLVLEGILYALAPGAMRRMLETALRQPEQTIRMTGLAAAVVGLVVVLVARS
ncbi:DUF2065 domain-containing protein [Emcibacter sp. SYSU 3D8]|uniref:DUF2065 domain-containing protein n=1 Tax=Emcibacter sp. SYSU 3D8 TaxID=3133969 RepID=UPI0031FEF0C3